VAEALQACTQDASAALSLSFFEIYCSKVFDLLRGRAEVRADRQTPHATAWYYDCGWRSRDRKNVES
jgi:hypothetical protein